MHNANMFFQPTSMVRMIDHIVTPPNSLCRINHGSCSAQLSRHTEYYYFREDCDLRNRISYSIAIKIHDLSTFCRTYRTKFDTKKTQELTTRRSPRVSSRIAELKSGTLYLRNASWFSDLLFAVIFQERTAQRLQMPMGNGNVEVE